MKSKVKSFVGFVEAAGYFSGLSKALEKNGLIVEQYYYFTNKFSYNPEKYRYFYILRFLYKHTDSPKYFVRNFSKLFFNICSIPFFIKCLISYEYYFLSSQSFFFFWSKRLEFKVLRFFKKKVVFIFLGSDSRAHFLSGYGLKYDVCQLKKKTRERISNLENVHSLGFPVIDLPSTSQLHSGEVFDFFKVGFPKDIPPRTPPLPLGKRVKVLHAPSVRKEKGSHLFKEIVEDLQKEIDFDYVEITGLSNIEVLEEIRSADLVIDEMYSDSLMAGIACESAWLGTCYLVFGERLGEMAEHYNWPLNNFARPEEAKEHIRRFILSADLRYYNASAANKIVQESWKLNDIGARILAIANGERLSALTVPRSIINKLCMGWGAPRRDIKAMIEMVSDDPIIFEKIKDLKLDD